MQVVLLALIPSFPSQHGVGTMVVSRPLCAIWVIFLILLLCLRLSQVNPQISSVGSRCGTPLPLHPHVHPGHWFHRRALMLQDLFLLVLLHAG